LLTLSFENLMYTTLLVYTQSFLFCQSFINQYFVQICDFGLAKWLPEQLTHHNMSTFEGTFGYANMKY